MSATQWKNEEIANKLNVLLEEMIPNAIILGYGCNDLSIIFDNQEDSLVIPPAGKITADRTPQIDVINYVTKDTAPIFFYHC